jgi:ABC-type multidrug transport system fused ATPase/permease subunit
MAGSGPTVLDTVRKYATLLPATARRQFVWLCLLAAVTGLLETASVASVIPFLAVLAQPGIAVTDPRIGAVVGVLGISHPSGALAALGGLVLLVLLATNAFSAMVTLMMLRFANRQGHALAVRLFDSYLRQPYTFHLHRHTAELQRILLSEVQRITVGALAPAVHMISRAFVIVFLLTLLLLADPRLALVVSAVLGTGYLMVFGFAQRILHAAGRESMETGTLQATHSSESLTGIKEIKLLGREREFVDAFARLSQRSANAHAKAQALATLPRYAVEAVAFGFVLVVAIYLLAAAGSVEHVLPLLGLYAFAGYRLLPALHQTFDGWAALRFTAASLDAVLRDLELEKASGPAIRPPDVTPLPFARELTLSGIAYRYPGAADRAVRGISLTVRKNTTIALVGHTGCGKTTVVDLLMGLLPVTEGRLLVDGMAVEGENVARWQRVIGHVPQQIFLFDDSVAQNIAFGIADSRIDMDRVERAARLAKLHDFVAGLPQRYATVVGQRGIRISGGERQRIGIARALYQDPELLVLDEATSALDNVTENAVLEALQTLSGRKTIVMIAHRLTTVRNCDQIYVMEAGHIVEHGSYDELMKSSERFRALAVAT